MASVVEAAKRLNVHERTVYNWLNNGKLKGSKNRSGEWEISIDSINVVLNKNEVETNLVKSEYIIGKELDDKEATALIRIGQFCKKFNETSSIEWAKKIALEVEEIEKLQTTKNIVSKIVSDNIQPMEKIYHERDERN